MKLVPRARPPGRVGAVAVAATIATGVVETVAATEAAEVSRAVDSRTRITAIARDSRANRAGSMQGAVASTRQLRGSAKFKEIRWQPLNLRSKSVKKK